jgi:hypothetical protein
MDIKKQFNALEGLKGFDATAKGSGPRLLDLPLSEPISKEEWEEYTNAKDKCESRRGDWRRERSEKHARIARIYAEACKEYERRYDQ